MSGRKTTTAVERLARHRQRKELGERLLMRNIVIRDMDAEELQAVKLVYISRLIDLRKRANVHDPRSPIRTNDEVCAQREIELTERLLNYHVMPALARALHEQVEQIITEHLDTEREIR